MYNYKEISRIDEIRSRLDAATPGPWEWGPPPPEDESNCDGWMTLSHCEVGWWQTSYTGTADADFIANTPTDIAYLLELLDELKAENAKLRKHAKAMAEALRSHCRYWPSGLGEGKEYEALAGFRRDFPKENL